MKVKTKGLLTVLFAYSCAIILGFISLSFSMTLSNMLQILIADIVATFTIYFFSVWYKNSSFYDPYWSVIPPIIAFYWIAINDISNLEAQKPINTTFCSTSDFRSG